MGGEGGGRRGLKTAEILLAESSRKQVSFESGFKQWKGRRISVHPELSRYTKSSY